MLFWKEPENDPYYWDGSAWQSFSPGSVGAHGPTHIEWGSDPIPNIEALEEEYVCDVAIVPGDIVYQDAANHVDLASADDPSKMPAIGIVNSKPDPTTARIISRGWYNGLTGLPAGVVWVGLNGTITQVPPEQPVSAVLQEFGVVKSANELQVAPQRIILL